MRSRSAALRCTWPMSTPASMGRGARSRGTMPASGVAAVVALWSMTGPIGNGRRLFARLLTVSVVEAAEQGRRGLLDEAQRRGPGRRRERLAQDLDQRLRAPVVQAADLVQAA